VAKYLIVGKIAEHDGWKISSGAYLVIALLANQKLVLGVPCYQWYHGCGPTSAGMIMAIGT